MRWIGENNVITRSFAPARYGGNIGAGALGNCPITCSRQLYSQPTNGGAG